MRAIVLIAVAGCAPAPTTSVPMPRVAPAIDAGVAIDTGISGRVLLDGTPVPYFGLTPITSAHVAGAPIAVRARDGRFRIPTGAASFDLVIAGPGFMRRRLVGVVVDADRITDLGDIDVSHGHTISGHVHDEHGRVVAGARVTLTADRAHADGELAERARGNLAATTDARGRFQLDDIGGSGFGTTLLFVAATAAGERGMEPLPLQNADADVDLVIQPIGTLEVNLAGGDDEQVFVRVTAVSHGVPLDGRDVDGVRRFEALPAGDYDVDVTLIDGRLHSATRVNVPAGAIVPVTIAVPTRPTVTVELHVRAGKCRSLTLTALRGKRYTVPCAGSDVTATIPPGWYKACADEYEEAACDHVRVEEAPATQRFSISLTP